MWVYQLTSGKVNVKVSLVRSGACDRIVRWEEVTQGAGKADEATAGQV